MTPPSERRGGRERRRPAPPVEHDTETMARVYLEQGKVAEAAAIYRRLITRAAEDADQIGHLRGLLADSETLKRDARQRAAAAAAALPARAGVDLAAIVPLGPGLCACLWEVTPRSREAARRQLGGAAGRLVLRIVTAGAGPAADAPTRAVRDVAVDDDAGERAVETPDGGVMAVAVGLRAGDGSFAAIVHAAPTPLPAASPGPAGASALLEVEPARGGPEAEPAVGRSVAP
ncbi:MAG TPA: hypothetical protein VGQ83_37885 [Polyangia bacterium]